MRLGFTALAEVSLKPPGLSSAEDRRAISRPLTPVKSGLSRSLADNLPCSSGHVTAQMMQLPKLTVRVMLARRLP